MQDDNPLLTTEEAAAMLRIGKRTLTRQRAHGIGPRFVRLGKSVRYRRRDLLAHLDRHSHDPEDPE